MSSRLKCIILNLTNLRIFQTSPNLIPLLPINKMILQPILKIPTPETLNPFMRNRLSGILICDQKREDYEDNMANNQHEQHDQINEQYGISPTARTDQT